MIGQHDAEHTVADDSEQQQEAIEPQDEAVTRYSVPDASPSSNEHIYVDLHIVYSPVYRVPVLYFRGRLQGIVLPLLQSVVFNTNLSYVQTVV